MGGDGVGSGGNAVRSLGFRTDLALLERSGSTVTDRGDHLVVRTADNPGFWWGNYLLLREAPLPADMTDWVSRFEAEFPDARHRAIGVDDPSLDVEAGRSFVPDGYIVEADTVMTAGVVHPPAHPNEEATYRSLTTDADWAQGVELALSQQPDDEARDTNRAFTTARCQAHRTLAESGTGRWFGAFLEGRLVAQMGLVSASPGLARFQDVETHPGFRRLGLAGTLVHHVSRYGFSDLEAHTLVMVADPDYPAIRIYRSLGFTGSEHQLRMSRPPGF